MGTKNKENKRINEEKKRNKLRADGESTSRRQATNQIRIPADRGRRRPLPFSSCALLSIKWIAWTTHTQSQGGTGGLIK
jgi:hypothetical protein